MLKKMKMTIDDFDLKINIFKPKDFKKGKKYPAIVFFFGGGWRNGNVHQFEHHCRYLASRGMVAMSANYRVASRNKTTPFDAVEDAKSAMRWIRENAKDLGVHKNKLVAAGGSAGGANRYVRQAHPSGNGKFCLVHY